MVIDLMQPIYVTTVREHGGPGFLDADFCVQRKALEHVATLQQECEAYRRLFEASPKMLSVLKRMLGGSIAISHEELGAIICEIEGRE